MLHSLQVLLAPAVAERATLVVNHVLNGEPVATVRLRAHAGRRVRVLLDAWPSLLPPPPVLAWQITPAGLLEWSGADAVGAPAPELLLRVDAANPALLLARGLVGEAPSVQIDGDAQLAADVSWTMQNVRWDAEADLERVFGPVVARQLHQVGSAVAAGLRKALQLAAAGAAGIGERLRPRTP